MKTLQRGAHIHLIAVCGVGMAPLAGLLQAQGYRVTGSDQNVYPPMSTYLADLRIEVMGGYAAEHLRDRPDLVVVGNAVSRNNPEVEEMQRIDAPYISFPQALGRFLIGDKRSLVVSGTHGKTTTSALMAWVLAKAGREPSFFIGGMPRNFSGGFQQGSGDWVVLEGDEYDTAFFDKGPKFLHYKAEKVILTSVEFDHADIYRDLEHLKSSFRRLTESLPPNGSLLVCNEYESAREVAGAARCPVVFYGDEKPEGWSARNIRADGPATWFEPVYNGRADEPVKVAMIGRHNVMNALAVYATAKELGLAPAAICEGMATFAGVRRRQEFKGEAGGVAVIDDFAHHPTAIEETIEAVKRAYPGRRVWGIFEPRSNTSRRRFFAHEFPRALARADRVVVAGVYLPDKIPIEDRLPAEEVVAEINRLSGGTKAALIEQPDAIARHVADNAARGDVVLVMSNGGFGGVQEKILDSLRKKHPAS
jgi:UDP-N-acetylmuramate: L-alanyl-gamma-D-glutamyl-meso-diaminopimelate ligase